MPKKKEFAGLTDARGLAILLVLFAHFSEGILSEYWAVILGNAGVTIFFILSGFLIDQTINEASLRSYAVRRAARILPMYWFSMAAAVLLMDTSVSVLTFLSNATFSAPLLSQERILGVYWTLYIEIAFYVIAPLIVRTRSALYVVLSIAMLSIIVRSLYGSVGSGAYFYICYCLIGCQLSAWHRSGYQDSWQLVTIPIVAVISGYTIRVGLGMILVSLACCTVIAAASFIRRQNRALAFCGRISYSLYLSHTILLHLMDNSVILATIASFIVSTISFLYIEKPIIDASKKLYTSTRRKPVHPLARS